MGTCVGAALYDPVARVGGLIHLLLPEPISQEATSQPEKFASTGFPIFLKALYDAGASAENTKASIAGGALVGPVDNSDLKLDIGGRTAEKVMQFLKGENIKIDKLETGGFFTCHLILDMHSGECRIEPAGFDKLSVDADIKIPEPGEISQSIKDLQPIPQVALKILRMVNNEFYEIHNLTDEIRKDQVISARTLQLCNSVMFATRKKIATLEHALVMLGKSLLLKFVISASLNNFFDQTGSGYSLCKGGLYHHAVGAAVIAEKLALLTKKVDPSVAYTAGLLHDIGKVVLDQFIFSGFPLFYRELNEKGMNFAEVEKRVFGTDHAEVGLKLAQDWSFPDSLAETIRYHHKPENAKRHKALANIVYLADLLMSRFHTGLELERLNTDALASRLEAIGFSLATFAELIDHIPLTVLDSSPELALGVN